MEEDLAKMKEMWLREEKEKPLSQSKVASHLCRDTPSLNKSLFEVGLVWLKDHCFCVSFSVAVLRI